MVLLQAYLNSTTEKINRENKYCAVMNDYISIY